MPASQNGWRANDRSVISTRLVPGTGVKLAVRNGAPGDLLLEVAGRFDREVEDIDGAADDWGYAERPIRGGTELSNHASGTAIDLNAPRHPLGADPAASFSRGQIDAIHRILAATGGVVRWGGDYTGRKDGMHFEINDGRTEDDCARALARLRGAGTGAPLPSSPAAAGVLQRGAKGDAVTKLQRVLAAWYPDLRLAVDGDFGPATEAAVRRVQQNAQLAVDGIAGPKTLGVLHLA